MCTQHVRGAYEGLRPTIEMLLTAYPEQLSADLFTWPAYLWAIELWYAYAIEVCHAWIHVVFVTSITLEWEQAAHIHKALLPVDFKDKQKAINHQTMTLRLRHQPDADHISRDKRFTDALARPHQLIFHELGDQLLYAKDVAMHAQRSGSWQQGHSRWCRQLVFA